MLAPHRSSRCNITPPSAAQGSVGTHGSARRLAAVLFQRIAGRKELTVSVQHIGERNGSGGKRLLRQVARPLERADLRLQPQGPAFQFDQALECVLDISRRAQNGLAIARQRLGVGATGLPDLSVHLAEIEYAPAQGAGGNRLERRRRQKAVGAQTVEAEQTR